jgi:hypothetical protein
MNETPRGRLHERAPQGWRTGERIEISLLYRDGKQEEIPDFNSLSDAVKYASGVALTAGDRPYAVIRKALSEIFVYEPERSGT